MELILLEKIRNLGQLGEQVKVKAGFGRNYLLPQGKAVIANAVNRLKFETQKAEFEKKAAELFELAKNRAEKITQLARVTVTAKVAEEGKLYGSIGIIDIVDAMNKTGVEVNKSEIKLSTGPIRHIGEYDITVYLHTDVTAIIKVIVIPEG